MPYMQHNYIMPHKQRNCQVSSYISWSVLYFGERHCLSSRFLGERSMPQRILGDRVLLSTSEAMQASGLSREHIQRLARQGRIEGIKPGHDWLVFEDSLQAFLAQPRKTGPKSKDSNRK